jgi:hypothetical protein
MEIRHRRDGRLLAQVPGDTLVEADLRGAELGRAHLRGVKMARADLRGANLTAADLRECDLRKADLSESNLLSAQLLGARLQGVILTGAVYDGSTQWPDGFDPDARGALRSEGDRSKKGCHRESRSDSESQPDRTLPPAARRS